MLYGIFISCGCSLSSCKAFNVPRSFISNLRAILHKTYQNTSSYVRALSCIFPRRCPPMHNTVTKTVRAMWRISHTNLSRIRGRHFPSLSTCSVITRRKISNRKRMLLVQVKSRLSTEHVMKDIQAERLRTSWK